MGNDAGELSTYASIPAPLAKLTSKNVKNLLQLGVCMDHVYANEYTIRFSTLIKPNKRFAIMEAIGLAIRPNHSGVKVISVQIINACNGL